MILASIALDASKWDISGGVGKPPVWKMEPLSYMAEVRK